MINKNILEEYNIVKNNVGLLDFSMEGKIKVSGNGRIDFIDGLVSNDVKNLQENDGVYAAFLDRFGKVLTDCIIYKFKDFLLINLNLFGKRNIINRLINESLLGKSEIEDVTLKYGLFSLQGPKSIVLLNNIIKNSLELKNQYDCRIKEITINDKKNNIIITKNNRTKEDGYDLFVPVFIYKEIKDLLLKDSKLISNDVYDILRLEAKIPLYGIDFTKENILPEITEKAVDYEKGCFVGQEVVARVKNIAKGLTAKKLIALEIDTDKNINKQEKIMCNDKEAGYITSSAFSPERKKVVALGFLKKEFYGEKEFEVDDKITVLN